MGDFCSVLVERYGFCDGEGVAEGEDCMLVGTEFVRCVVVDVGFVASEGVL